MRHLVGVLLICVGSAQVYFARSLEAELPARPSCRETPRTSSHGPLLVTWQSPADEAQRRALTAWCDAVGPAVIEADPTPSADAAISPQSVAIVSWNLHVGGADLPGFVAALRQGEFTDGTPAQHFVLLLQEAYRSGSDVPLLRSKEAIASRIDPRPPTGVRQDIVAAARELGLSVFYVPSMRNGSEAGDRAEDRGNAILSTLPLSDFRAIELPFERQRRVAIIATVSGVQADNQPWRLVVSSAHLDATAGLGRLRVFATGVRARQARALASALNAEPGSLVMGSDLNTWWDGPNEPAYQTLEALFPDTPKTAFTTHFGGMTLDYLLFRLPPRWRGGVRPAASRFGSDHSPLIGTLASN